jgi:hypothetical protein
MRCPEVVEALPEVTPAVEEHLRECASCRALEEAYRRDAEGLAAGLRSAAGTVDLGTAVLMRLGPRPGAPRRDESSPARRLWPVLAAAAVLLGIVAVILLQARPPRGVTAAPEPPREKPSLIVVQGAEEDGGEVEIIPIDQTIWAQVVSAAGPVAVSAGRADGVLADQRLTVYRPGRGGYREIGKLVIEKVEESLSTGRLEGAREPARVGDFVLPGRPLSSAERRALLDYLFSFRAVTEKDEADVRAALERLEGGDRLAGRALAALGAPGRLALDRIGQKGLGPEARDLLREALSDLDRHDRLVRGVGLERDVEFLARVKDPRAHDRLKRILSAVSPFAQEGLAAAGPDLAATLHGWWAARKDRVRWNTEADRYEE